MSLAMRTATVIFLLFSASVKADTLGIYLSATNWQPD